MTSRSGHLLALSLCAVLGGCGGFGVKDSAPSGSIGRLPDDAIPRNEPKGRYGNGPVYEVFGKRYSVMDSSAGYKERGVASWYGKKFHGELTSSREIYDMHAMTAAHKTLPLPTYVRVRNLRNNKTVVVRVNDRGPFVGNRIIDLSYSAALKLDIVRDGTGMVEVTAINFGQTDARRNVPQTNPGSQGTPAPSRDTAPSNSIFVQVGAFGSRDNAARRFSALNRGGITGAVIREDKTANPTLYRVRIGPIHGAVEYDKVVAQLARLGIEDPILVTE